MNQAKPLRVIDPRRFHLETISGRITEISGDPALTIAFTLVVQAQLKDEPVAWITPSHAPFFAPDADRAGADLRALAVIRTPGPKESARAADKLVRSGAFGLVVVDLPLNAQIPLPMLSRLGSLACRHDTALLCLTQKKGQAPSLILCQS